MDNIATKIGRLLKINSVKGVILFHVLVSEIALLSLMMQGSFVERQGSYTVGTLRRNIW